jgi:hypothetical protein
LSRLNLGAAFLISGRTPRRLQLTDKAITSKSYGYADCKIFAHRLQPRQLSKGQHYLQGIGVPKIVADDGQRMTDRAKVGPVSPNPVTSASA